MENKQELPSYFTYVKIIKDSISTDGYRLTTIEAELPRYIWAECLTHRWFERNAQSSRAVPVKEVLRVNRESPVFPIIWGKNKAGMSSTEELNYIEKQQASLIWATIAEQAFQAAEELVDLGLHKQWLNRITEPFSRIKVIITATEWDNFFWLRDDLDAAQPEIVDFARKAKKAFEASTPQILKAGEWHLPYVNNWRDIDGTMIYLDEAHKQIPLELAKDISASACAQVSYRKLDQTAEKAEQVRERLLGGTKPHWSPYGHQGTPMKNPKGGEDYILSPNYWEKGITSMDRSRNFLSGNLKGWLQFRQLI